MKGFFKEFKDFAMRGNVIDLAVGVIIGGAFQKIVTSVVNDLVMPLIGLITKGSDFASKFVALDGGEYATIEEATEAVEEMEQKVREIIGEYIYSNADEDLINVVGRLLLEKNITISSAESCTGGKFAAALTEIPGISKVFERGLVTYSNQSKMDELGVKAETLEKFGAVSPETAEEMVRGLAEKTG